jgi:hypothetical protein
MLVKTLAILTLCCFVLKACKIFYSKENLEIYILSWNMRENADRSCWPGPAALEYRYLASVLCRVHRLQWSLERVHCSIVIRKQVHSASSEESTRITMLSGERTFFHSYRKRNYTALVRGEYTYYNVLCREYITLYYRESKYTELVLNRVHRL